jgi:hypothetical protein
MRKLSNRALLAALIVLAASALDCSSGGGLTGVEEIRYLTTDFRKTSIEAPEGTFRIAANNKVSVEMNHLYGYPPENGCEWFAYIRNKPGNLYSVIGKLKPDQQGHSYVEKIYPSSYNPFESADRDFRILLLHTRTSQLVSCGFRIKEYGAHEQIRSWRMEDFENVTGNAVYDRTANNLKIVLKNLPPMPDPDDDGDEDWCYCLYVESASKLKYFERLTWIKGSDFEYTFIDTPRLDVGDEVRIHVEPREADFYYPVLAGKLSEPARASREAPPVALRD